MNRKDISEKLSQNKVDTLLIAGGKSQYLSGVNQLHAKMDKSKTSFVKIDDVTNVLDEAPQKLAQSILLFVKGELLSQESWPYFWFKWLLYYSLPN